MSSIDKAPIGAMIGIVLTTFILAFCHPIPAQADAVYIHGMSDHYTSNYDGWNESNYGVSYRAGDTNYKQYGVFQNSRRKVSVYATFGRAWHKGPVRYGWGLGLATGYNSTLYPWGTFFIESGPIAVNILPGVAVLSLRYEFNE